MSNYVPYIVIGITEGAIYGIAALGLVLTYRTSGILNFGHGAVAAAAAMVFYELHYRQSIDWPLAAVIAVIPFGIVAGLLMERLAASLAQVPTSYRIVATVGMVLAIPALSGLVFGDSYPVFTPFLPANIVFTISGVQIDVADVLTAGIGVVAAIGLFFFLNRSRLGISMRAVVDRPALLDLTGESPTRVRRISWIIGCSFAAISGVLLINVLSQLNVLLLALLVVPAFGAAAFGAFTNLPMAFVGGVVIGIAQAIMGKEGAAHPSLTGLDLNIPFLFLFFGLLIIPKKRLVELGERVRLPVRTRVQRPLSQRAGISGIVLLVAIVIPFVVGSHLPIWTSALAQLTLFLSLSLLVRTSGQISLCQVGLAAVGATTFAHMLSYHVPWGVAVLVAGLVTIPVGAIIAIPAIRLSGLFLALATLGFGILLNEYFYTKGFMFGAATALSTARPHLFGLSSNRGYYFLLLIIGILAIGLVTLIERARLGRLLRAMSDSPTALSTLGTNTSTTRVIIFCISAFLAGVSGALIAGEFSSISSSPFPYLESLIVLAVLTIAGRRTIASAIIGTILLTVPAGYISGTHVADVEQLIFGVLAIGAALTVRLQGWPIIGRYGANLSERLRGPGGSRLIEGSSPFLAPKALS